MQKSMKDHRIEQRLQREIESLHGNEGITGDLEDRDATVFLDWAEGHVKKIVHSTAELEDADAEVVMYPRLKAMRRIARYVNQAVRHQGELSVLVEKIINQSRELYGEAFQEPDFDKIEALLNIPNIEPGVLIQTLKHLLEGEMDGAEEQSEQ